ncbi:MAG TPA: AtpZ/AtpI family protein [Candidatus Cybelea sp.]|nr:AtpZ/AtpI family protein [Candidatus Cybelea sp.]
MELQDPRPNKNSGGAVKQMAMAMELPFLIAGPPVIAGGIGYFVDLELHTKPWMMIVLGVCGVALGLREVIKLAGAGDKKSE